MACILAVLLLGATPAAGQEGTAAAQPTAQPSDRASDRAPAEPPPEVARMTVSDLGDMWHQNEALILAVLSAGVLLLLWATNVITPGGLAKGGLRDVDPLPVPVWLFAGMVAYLALYAAVAVAQMPALENVIHGPDGPPPADAEPTLRALATTQALSYALAIIAGVGMLYLLSKTAPDAGLKVSGLDLPIGIGCFLLAYPIVALSGVASVFLYEYFQEGAPDPIAHSTLGTIISADASAYRWLLIAAVVIGAPVLEEIIYRGFLQSAMLKLTGSAWGAIFLTSFAFTAVHFPWGGPGTGLPYHALLMIFVLSLALGAAYERTRRISVPVVMHACFNALNIALALWLTGGAS